MTISWETTVEKMITGRTFLSNTNRGKVYCRLYCPMHPAAVNGRVQEHRLVAEAKIGRYLVPGEVVHHVNGDSLDNRPENIEVFRSQRDHVRHHWAEGGYVGSRVFSTDAEIIALIDQGLSERQIKKLARTSGDRIRDLRRAA